MTTNAKPDSSTQPTNSIKKENSSFPIIDDAHLVPVETTRKLRLLLEDFPKNHNLILS